MKTVIDTEQLKANINLIELAGRYTELRKVTAKEHHGPCPWCGGDDRFRVTADYFACRQCGRKGDTIEFVMQRQNVDFRTAASILGGDVPMNTGEKRKPMHKPAESTAKPLDDNRARKLMDAHRKLVSLADGVSRHCMAYLADRGITIDTAKAFSVGCETAPLPGTWDHDSKKTIQPYKNGVAIQPHQWAISLPWFNHDGALVAVKYRFIESHVYMVNGKEQSGKDSKGVRFTSSGPVISNTFGWQALRGAGKVDVLIICEGEMNALSLWQAGRGAVDVLSTGSEATTKKLPPVVVDLAQKYKHRIVWADKKEIADAAALQIGAASMGSPNGKDANDLLKAGKLGALLAAMLGRLGVSLPAESPVSQSVTESHTDGTPHHTPTSHTGVRSEPTATNTQLIQDAQPFDFNLEPEAAPAVDRVAALADQLRPIAALPSFDERLDALEPLHAAVGALSYTEVRDPSIVAELLNIFKKQSSVDAFLKKYGAAPTATDPAPLDAGQLAYYQRFVGKIVSDEVITGLILDANRHGFQITFDAQGDWRHACDYKVTGARFS